MSRRTIVPALCLLLGVGAMTPFASGGNSLPCSWRTAKTEKTPLPLRKGTKKAEAKRYAYYIYNYGTEGCDTTLTFLLDGAGCQYLFGEAHTGKTIPGYARACTYLAHDSLYRQLLFQDGSKYFSASPFSAGAVEWQTEQEGSVTHLRTTVNSNSIELVMSTQEGVDVNPVTYYGPVKGLMKQYIRNGQVAMELASVEREKGASAEQLQAFDPATLGIRMERRALAKLKEEKIVQTWRIFDSAQLHWGAENLYWTEAGSLPHEAASYCHPAGLPKDTVIHFSGGTVVLKRVTLPALPSHYQWFAELHERSVGDAYDRTGSLFVIPQEAAQTFFRGMAMSPDSLPSFLGKDGERYQGMVSLFDDKGKGMQLPPAQYLVPLELVRFFTPFGVHHYNGRVQVEGMKWQDEAYYKQEITDLAACLHGDVWIGAFIGNYDGGGHRLTLDLKAYPQSEEWTDSNAQAWLLPLFNTCNVLEMSGQNYGKFFGTDSLTVRFYLPDSVEHVRLRYLSTGHGGWDTGDEFVPKENHLLIDGQHVFSHTPWRTDCGTYRDKNPVSGTSWTGTTSSDYSRSGWCPGTATQPVYFDLSWLAPGWHTLTVAIPQGAPVEGGFSGWNVSGCLVGSWRQAAE